MNEAAKEEHKPWYLRPAPVLGVIATLISITLGAWNLWDKVIATRGNPSFAGRIVAKSDAARFLSFVESHHDDIVELDLTCNPSTDADYCQQAPFEVDEAYRTIAREGESIAVMEVFGAAACYSLELDERCPGTRWLLLRTGPDSDAQVDNGQYGAGALVVRGTFRALVRGNLGTAPPNVSVIELKAVASTSS